MGCTECGCKIERNRYTIIGRKNRKILCPECLKKYKAEKAARRKAKLAEKKALLENQISDGD